MKALAAAILLSVLMVSGVLVWALGSGTNLSGEPVTVLHIDPGSSEEAVDDQPVEPVAQQTTAKGATPAKAAGEGYLVTLDVAPTTSAEATEGLFEESPYGSLPRRASDGRTVAKVFARGGKERFDATPRIAIVVRGLGLDKRLTREAIDKLPSQVSLAFSAYGVGLVRQVEQAQTKGHETILQLPLEPVDYPHNDTGPKTLLVAAGRENNRPRLYWSLGRFKGYFAVMNNKGGHFLTELKAVENLFGEVKRRGLVFFSDNRNGSSNLSSLAGRLELGYAHADVELDRRPDQASIRAALAKLEITAKRSGFAIGLANMHAVSLDTISSWARRLKRRGFKLVPVSAAYVRNGKEL